MNPVLWTIIKNIQSFGIEDMKLSREKINNIVNTVLRNMPHEECKTCDCFLGFITQLELDSSEDVRDITEKLKPSKDQIHRCLGCDPCPPAEAYTKYIRKKLGLKVKYHQDETSNSYNALELINNKQNTHK